MTGHELPCVTVGVDGSPGSHAALTWAWRAAADRGTRLRVVAVYPVETFWGDPDLLDPRISVVRRRTAEGVAAVVAEVRAAAGTPPGVAVDVDLVAGQAAEALVHVSAAADLLVVGSRGRGPVRSTVLGSVALHCAAHARCPVVVVHGGPSAPGAPVVVGLEDSAVARAALGRALAEAARLGAPLHAVTALPVPEGWGDFSAGLAPPLPTEAELERRGSELVAEALAAAGSARPVDVRVEVAEGAPAEVLAERAAGAALLVVGSRSRSRVAGMLLGSVALHCAVAAPCPVMVVHPAPVGVAG